MVVCYKVHNNKIYTVVRLIMADCVMAGKNNGGINMAELPKNRQI